MSNLIGNLLNHGQTLGVQGYAIETTGRNMTNVNNPNYARQRVSIAEGLNYRTGTLTHSMGLEALGVEHIRNAVLDRQITNEKMERAALEKEYQLLMQMETNLNEFISQGSGIETLDGANSLDGEAAGLTKSIDDFLNAFAELAALPNSHAQRSIALQRAADLARHFNIADARLNEFDTSIAKRIQDDVQQVNLVLDQIAELNRKIARFEIRPGVIATDLRDERQAAMEQLALYINFEAQEHPSRPNVINILTRDTSNPPEEVLLVNGDVPSGKVYYDAANESIMVTTPGAAPDLELQIRGGSIKGALDVKTQSLVHLRADLDALANGLVTTVNAAYNPNNVPGQVLFDPAGISIGTIALDAGFYNADGSFNTAALLVTENAGGGNELAQAIGRLVDDGTTMGNTSFKGYLSGVIARVGNETAVTSRELENQKIVEDFLRRQRESISGVNIDEEMTNLLRFQRAYQGTARVINVLDQMLEVTVSGLVR